MTADPYMDPLTGILRNLLGITTAQQLQRAERRLTRAALLRLAEHSLPGHYDLAHLQAFHRALFGDIYVWAGQIRTVNIARTDFFALYSYIESYASEVFDRLAAENRLRGLHFSQFIERLAHYYGEVNAIHPFRNGNGRAQRAFFAQMAAEADWRIGWVQLDPETNVTASLASLRGNNRALEGMFRSLVAPTDGGLYP
ncbi:MAG: Fic/DOC family protein [Chloroflexota bacterium]